MTSQREQSATAKHWLMRSVGSHRYIKALERRLESFTFANITRYENDGVPPTNTGENATETRMIEFSEINRLIEETRDRIASSDVETLRMIDRMTSNLQKTVLVERYINLLNFDEIAKKIDYSTSHVHRLHGEALLSLYKILYEEGKT